MHILGLDTEVIEYYRIESGKAIKTLSNAIGRPIDHVDFQVKLGEKFGYVNHDSHCVPIHRLSCEQMLLFVSGSDFPSSDEEETVIMDASVLPEGSVVFLTEEEIKSKGEIWVIHKNDADPFPSNPHAHNKQDGYKLHLGSGDLYTSKNKPLNQRISKKNLLAIRGKVKNIKLPALLV